jgi:hypothetical protein
MLEAQARWPFLSHFDSWAARNERQLVSMTERCSLSRADAQNQVRHWMERDRF